MGDYKYLVQQFNSQESARWKNKIANNRLENEICGKGGIEHERAFQLKSVELERRRIQEELDTIRSHGRRRSTRRNTKPEILTTSLNPPLSKPEVALKDRRPAVGISGRRATLTGYYGIHANQIGEPRNESKLSPAQKTVKDYAQTHVGVNVGTGAGLPSHVGPTAKNEPIFVKFDPDSATKSQAIFPTKGVIENPLRNPAVYQRRHMVEFVDEDRLTHNKAGKISKFGSARASHNSGSPWEHSGENSSRQTVGAVNKSTNASTLNELNVNTARENIARRLTDQAPVPTEGELTKSQTDPAKTARQDNGELKTDGKSEEPESMATNLATDAAKRMDQDSGNTKTRRGSKNDSVTDILKGSKFDADMYNPDGSLRTKHQVRSFEQSYEEARKARYIRSKERSELDKELSIKEVFDKPDNSDKHSQADSA